MFFVVPCLPTDHTECSTTLHCRALLFSTKSYQFNLPPPYTFHSPYSVPLHFLHLSRQQLCTTSHEQWSGPSSGDHSTRQNRVQQTRSIYRWHKFDLISNRTILRGGWFTDWCVVGGGWDVAVAPSHFISLHRISPVVKQAPKIAKQNPILHSYRAPLSCFVSPCNLTVTLLLP